MALEAENVVQLPLEETARLHEEALNLYATLYSTLGFDNTYIYKFVEGVAKNIEYLKGVNQTKKVSRLVKQGESIMPVLRYFLKHFTEICVDTNSCNDLFTEAVRGIRTDTYQAIVNIVSFGLPEK